MTNLLMTDEESEQLFDYEIEKAQQFYKWAAIVGFVIWVIGAVA